MSRRRTIDPQVQALAESVLNGAQSIWIESLAERLQAECDDSRAEYEKWLEEQRSLKRFSDAVKARI